MTNHYRCNKFSIFPALPDDTLEVSHERVFYGVKGSTVRMDCSITPGVFVSQYYITWRSASNHSLIFYKSYPPHLNFPTFILDDRRYSVDADNFSLYIHNMGPADITHQYQCVLGVEDPLFETTREFLYTVTEYTNLSLLGFSAGIVSSAVHAVKMYYPFICV